jgi:pantothenate kinase
MYSVLERHKEAAIIETKVIDKCIQFWKDINNRHSSYRQMYSVLERHKQAAIIDTKVIDKCIQFWKDINRLQ